MMIMIMVQFNLILYYQLSGTTAIREITNTAQEKRETYNQ